MCTLFTYDSGALSFSLSFVLLSHSRWSPHIAGGSRRSQKNGLHRLCERRERERERAPMNSAYVRETEAVESSIKGGLHLTIGWY
jgi:hypothetical protein